MKQKFVPTYEGELRKHALQIPRCISECSGIRVFGRRIKSLVFSTDVAIIKNINADAVIAVYNFTPQPSITQAIISVSDVPVFAGVGGGYTNGQRSVNMAAAAEQLGAFGVVCNAMITNDAIRDIKSMVEIPVVFTVVSEHVDLDKRLAAGVDIVNVSGAARTPEIVRENTSQTASVEFCRKAAKLCAQQTAIPLSENSEGIFDSSETRTDLTPVRVSI